MFLASKMKATIALACFVSLIVHIQSETVEEKFFEQKLDHVDGIPGTWKQRYLENKEFHKDGGPIFLFVGGTALDPLVPQALHKGSMVEYAKEQGAHIIGLESRYLGKSRPTTDLSNENLNQFYTVVQVTTDTFDFVKALKTRPEFVNAKVVGFGTLLSGPRLKVAELLFPGLFDILVFSSTPVEIKFEFPEFMEKTVEILKRTDPECYETIHDGLLCLEKIVQGETCQGHNLTDLKPGLNLCDDLDPSNTQDVAGLFHSILTNIAGVVAINNPDPMFPYNVEKMCKFVTDKSSNLSNIIRMAIEITKITAFRKDKCLEFQFEKVFEKLNNSSWESPGVIRGERQTVSSRCRGVSPFIPTAESFNLTFADKLATNYTTELCHRLFNITTEEIKARTSDIDAKYGGRKIPSKCSIFVSGGDDLFQSLEITTQKEAGECNRAIVIEGAAVAKDKEEISPDGISHPPGLYGAQVEIGKLIGEWLKTGDCCLPKVN